MSNPQPAPAPTPPPTAAAPLTGYRADIDRLRALAVGLVLVFHFRLFGLGEAGFLGVDVFFVISGYLITGIVLGQLDAGRFELRRFYEHRIRRLAPALGVTLLGVLVAGSLLYLPADWAEMVRQIAASQTYVANLYFWKNVSYFGLSAERSVLLHTWSLAVEEQFYLFYPLGLMLLHRYARRWLVPALIFVGLLSFALNLALVGPKPGFTFYGLPTRAWQLLAGAGVQLLAQRWQPGRLASLALGAFGLALLLLAVTFYDRSMPIPGWFALLPVAAAAALIAAGTTAGSAPVGVSRWLGWAPLVYLGRISYPAYLVHWPLHVMALGWAEQAYGLPQRWLMFAVSLLLAALVFHAVEQPVRQGRWLARPSRLWWAYGAALAATLGVLALSGPTQGWAQRFPPEVVRQAAQVADSTPALPACEPRGGPLPPEPAPACRLGPTQGPIQWLVWGDSHAWAGQAAFDLWLRARGESGTLVFLHGCPPVLGVHLPLDHGHCAGVNQSVMDWLALHPETRSVLLVSTWLQAAEGILGDQADGPTDAARSLAVFDRQFTATLAQLQTLGRQAVVWQPVPGARRSVPQALARATLAGRPADNLEWTRAEHDHRFAFFFQALAREQAQHRVTAAVPIQETLCASGRCAVTLNSRALYFDTAHPSRSTAPFWAEVLGRVELPAPLKAEAAAR